MELTSGREVGIFFVGIVTCAVAIALLIALEKVFRRTKEDRIYELLRRQKILEKAPVRSYILAMVTSAHFQVGVNITKTRKEIDNLSEEHADNARRKQDATVSDWKELWNRSQQISKKMALAVDSLVCSQRDLKELGELLELLNKDPSHEVVVIPS